MALWGSQCRRGSGASEMGGLSLVGKALGELQGLLMSEWTGVTRRMGIEEVGLGGKI